MTDLDRFHPPTALVEDFCRENNRIEGEFAKGSDSIGTLYPNDLGVIREVISYAASNTIPTEKILLELHRKLCQHLDVTWSGKYRTCELSFPPNTPPSGRVPHIMANYFLDWNARDSWTNYIKFEHIHPFQDRNGRLGRLLWLWAELRDGWQWQRNFLEEFHYQTLQNTPR